MGNVDLGESFHNMYDWKRKAEESRYLAIRKLM
jgi:hypothetical protein